MFAAPPPTVTVTTQTVDQTLILQCEVTIVRNITGRVDILWISDDGVLRRFNDTTATATINNSLVYREDLTIVQLRRADDGRVFWCEVVINAIPPITANGSITLTVIGTYVYVLVILIYKS